MPLLLCAVVAVMRLPAPVRAAAADPQDGPEDEGEEAGDRERHDAVKDELLAVGLDCTLGAADIDLAILNLVEDDGDEVFERWQARGASGRKNRRVVYGKAEPFDRVARARQVVHFSWRMLRKDAGKRRQETLLPAVRSGVTKN